MQATIDGWRVGRNPPSVPSSICLIGEPAPQAELIGVYIPFHSAMGARFIPRPVLRFRLVGGVSSKHTAYAMGSVTAHRLATQS